MSDTGKNKNEQSAASKIVSDILEVGDKKSPTEPNTSINDGEPQGALQEILREQVIDELRTIYDPEIPVNIYELGLIYDLNVTPEGEVWVKMTLTSPACPVAEILPPQVENAIAAIPGVKDAEVEVVWDPPYSMEMMSESARLQLGLMW
jgi:FeS assembly SUF system protein